MKNIMCRLIAFPMGVLEELAFLMEFKEYGYMVSLREIREQHAENYYDKEEEYEEFLSEIESKR